MSTVITRRKYGQGVIPEEQFIKTKALFEACASRSTDDCTDICDTCPKLKRCVRAYSRLHDLHRVVFYITPGTIAWLKKEIRFILNIEESEICLSEITWHNRER